MGDTNQARQTWGLPSRRCVRGAPAACTMPFMRTHAHHDGSVTSRSGSECVTTEQSSAPVHSRHGGLVRVAIALICSWLYACRSETPKAQGPDFPRELPVGRGPNEVLHSTCSVFGRTNDACRASCERDGRCWMTEFNIEAGCDCAPVSDDDCKRARGCKARGLCYAGEGECVPGGDEHCQQSIACQERGLCAQHYDWESERAFCGARSDAGCKASHACATAGKCAWLGFGCVATQVCADALDCKDEGLCGVWLGRCAATESAHCAASNACSEFGRCTAHEGRCVATSDAMCRDSGVCRREGRCNAEYGECAARSDADCRAAIVCKHGECWAIDGRCSARGTPPADADACVHGTSCREHGNCDLRRLANQSMSQCLPSTTAHCAASLDCKRYGKCGLATPTSIHCEPPADDECRKSLDCTRVGACTRVVMPDSAAGSTGAVCRATTNEDCTRARTCHESGACFVRAGVCVNWSRLLESNEIPTDYLDNF